MTRSSHDNYVVSIEIENSTDYPAYKYVIRRRRGMTGPLGPAEIWGYLPTSGQEGFVLEDGKNQVVVFSRFAKAAQAIVDFAFEMQPSPEWELEAESKWEASRQS